MTEQEQYELTKQEKTRDVVERIVQMLREIDVLTEDINQESKALEEQYNVKASLVKNMAKEVYASKSTEAIEKAKEVVEQVKTLFNEGE